MAGMTASIARMIREGTLTTPECARLLGITGAQLQDRLFQMERQGFLARLKDGADSGCSLGHCCKACTLKGCGAVFPARFLLSEKGERIIPKERKPGWNAP